MKALRDFQINIFNLDLKEHEFEFIIEDRFFEYFENSIIQKGHGNCRMVMDKSATMMTLHFFIDVFVELTCDRSLDQFEYPIQLKERLIIKFGEENYALSEDVIVIKGDTPTINVSEYIYEYISLAVPMKKLHPRYGDEEDDEPDLIYSSADEDPEENQANEDQIDPRWEALKRLKGNK